MTSILSALTSSDETAQRHSEAPTMKTYIATGRLPWGPLVQYEVNAEDGHHANLIARRVAHEHGHHGRVHFTSIEMREVQSSNLHRIGYDRRRRVLKIEFRGRKGEISRYSYADINPRTYRELIAAESIGAYFNQRVRSREFTREV
jgi:hypothetical protein